MSFNIINPPVLGSVIKYTATILAGTNSITITHNLGRIVQVNGIFGTDNNANIFIKTNENSNSFTIAVAGGMLVGANTGIEGTYV